MRDRSLVPIACGANINFDRLRFVAERAEVGEQREAILVVTIPEQPGSFRKFCAAIGPRHRTEFNDRIADPDVAHVFVGPELHARAETARIMRRLERHGFEMPDLSRNEMVKLHGHHLVGGHAAPASNDLLYRFEVPERPGALLRFLDAMRSDWNISLFRYRNHDFDYGRVLVGIQVPPGEVAAFRHFVTRVAHPFADETGNPAYRLFLAWHLAWRQQFPLFLSGSSR